MSTVTPPTSPPTFGWTLAGVAAGGEAFAIDGVDVFRHPWQTVVGAPAIDVRDPHYGQPYRMPVYRIVDGPRTIVFAAGEFSNGVWGIYVPAARAGALPSMDGRPLIERLVPYVPMLAAIVEVPWVVVLVMMAMGTRENSTGPNPYWERQFSAAACLPAGVGLLAGIGAIAFGRPRGWLARIALFLGWAACAAFAFYFGRGIFAPLQ